MSHDPLYEITPEDKLAIRIITAVGALLAFMAVGYALGGGWGAREKTPAESPPPPELQETRTHIETGRMICEKTGEHGCVEWRIYRTTSY